MPEGYKKNFRRKRKGNRKARIGRKLPYNAARIKVRGSYPLVISSTGQIDLSLRVNSLSSTFLQDSSITGLNGVSTTALRALYDSYKVDSVAMRYVPRVTDYQYIQPNGTATAGNPFPLGLPMCALAYDPDNDSAPPGFQSMIQRDQTKVLDMSKGWRHHQKVKFVNMNGIGGDNSTEAWTKGGYHNLQQEEKNVRGVIWLKSDQQWQAAGTTPALAAGTLVGSIVTTFYLVVKDRTGPTAKGLIVTSFPEGDDELVGTTGTFVGYLDGITGANYN